MSTSRTAETGKNGAGSGSVARVVADARRLNLRIEPVRLDASTRTAEDAARACGCAVDQIVKSIIFRQAGCERHVLFLTAGSRRVDTAKAAILAGAVLEKADAASVRSKTGFVIGGVSPLGHLNPIETFLDPRLLDFELIWAAAGTPNHVFSVNPHALRDALEPVVADFTA